MRKLFECENASNQQISLLKRIIIAIVVVILTQAFCKGLIFYLTKVSDILPTNTYILKQCKRIFISYVTCAQRDVQSAIKKESIYVEYSLVEEYI